MPEGLREFLRTFESIPDERTRYALLVEYAEAFQVLPPDIASPPYPEENRVPYCESGMYVWVVEQDHRLNLFFAVENPQGISARAFARILQETCSGASPREILEIPDDLPQRLFGRALSMGRTLGLGSALAMIKQKAREHIARCPLCSRAS